MPSRQSSQKSGEQSRPRPPKTADSCHHEKKEQIRRPVGITGYRAKRIANAQMTRRSVKPYCCNAGRSCSFCQFIIGAPPVHKQTKTWRKARPVLAIVGSAGE